MVFDYDAANGTISISDYTAVPPYENQIADIDTLIRRRQISPDDQKKLKNAAALTTPDSPDASVTAAIYVDGKPVRARIASPSEHSGRSISHVGSSVLSAMRTALTVRKRSSLN